MRTKTNLSPQQVTKLGGPLGGAAWAVGIARDADGLTLFFGSAVGVYRAQGFSPGAEVDWERLPNGPLGIVSLAVSPRYTQDHTLYAGTNTGVFVSRDGGNNWVAGKTP